MKRLIYKYLSSAYSVKGNKVYINSSMIVNVTSLIRDLNKVFGFNKAELKWYIKGWIKKQNKGFDFNKYWNSHRRFGVWSNGRISTDFLTVEPMAAPTGRLFYMDYVYGIDPCNLEGQPVSVSSRMAERYRDKPINEDYYGTFTVRHEQDDTLENKIIRAAEYIQKKAVFGEINHSSSRTFSIPDGGW